MIQAIRPVGYDYDSEYLRIVRELQKYGLTPTGNKQVDKSRLNSARQNFVDKLKDELSKETTPNSHTYPDSSLEEKRVGANMVAEINKILLGL